MSKSSILILCPSGHRRKAQVTPNSNLLQVLEEICAQEGLDSCEWGLIHQRKKLDLTIPWRLLAIPSNALLEMYQLEERRAVKDITIQLQLPDGTRECGLFPATTNLNEMLKWFQSQPNSHLELSNDSTPICTYMSEEIIGQHALSHTTLRDLGLTGGTAVIRFSHRSISDEELKKINDRIDEKLARRQQKTAEKRVEPPPTASAPPSIPSVPEPVPFVLPQGTTTWQAEPFSVFREIPPEPPKPKQPKSTTLAEALGLRVQFEERPMVQPDFSNFKFPETTKGQNLLENDASNKVQSSAASSRTNEFDRRPIVYDLTEVPSSTSNQSEDLPDDFFELTADDLRSILTTLRQQSSEESPLETRSMRERVQSARTVHYETIAIRFLLNRNYILQGLFKSTETIVELTEFLRSSLICPQLHQSEFYLYTSPPRQVLSDPKKSLQDYDLAPAAMVYLGHRTVSPMKIDLTETLPRGTLSQANAIVQEFVFQRARPVNNDASQSAKPRVNDQQLKDKLRKFLPGKK